MSELEAQFESLCTTVMKTDSENWEVKNRAVLQMTELTQSYEGQSPQVIQEAFTANLFRALKEPIKVLISDLRSQQVRDACLLLVTLAQVAGERMKLFLRDAFPHILEGIKVPNKVMSGYVDECILMMIKYTAFKTAIPVLAQEVALSKAKLVRERCLDYLNEILISWELLDKDLDPLCDAIKLGLEDASLKAREVARIAYGNLFLLFPKRTERIRSELPKALQQKLLAAEDLLREGNGEASELHDIDSSLSASTESVSKPPPVPVQQVAVQPPPAPPTAVAAKATPSTPAHHHTTSSNTAAQASQQKHHHPISHNTPNHAHSKSASHISTNSTSTTHHTPAKTASTNNLNHIAAPAASSSSSAASSNNNSSTVKVPKESNEERAASAIQASMRGALSRRRSIVKNPFLELSDSFGSHASSSSGHHSSMFRASPEKPSSPELVNKSSPNKKKSPSREVSASQHTLHNHSSSPAKGKVIVGGGGSNKNSRHPSPLRGVGKSTDDADDHNSGLAVNMRVMVNWGKESKAKGVIRYLGKTLFANGIWVGVELEGPQGKNNGCVQGHYYFSCPTNHGLFVREESVIPIMEEETALLSNSHRSTFGSNVSDLTTFSDDEACPTGNQHNDESVDGNAPNTNVTSSSNNSNTSTIYEKNKKSASILKIKLSQLMNLLNQQLEIVEELEREEKKIQTGDQNSTTLDKIKDLKEEVAMITLQESDIIDGFKTRWKELLY